MTERGRGDREGSRCALPSRSHPGAPAAGAPCGRRGARLGPQRHLLAAGGHGGGAGPARCPRARPPVPPLPAEHRQGVGPADTAAQRKVFLLPLQALLEVLTSK